ncbi:MAG: tetratricopeptide repeat protein [Gemmatimonadales bacterium]
MGHRREQHLGWQVILPLIILTVGATPLLAQEPPSRPSVGDADTLDARSFFEVAMRRGSRAAAYWASRLEPDDPRYVYLMYVIQRRGARNPEQVAALDSVYDAVLTRDPFPYIDGPCFVLPNIERERDPAIAGILYLFGNCHAQATEKFAEGLARDPSALQLHFWRGQSFYFRREYRAARAELTILIDSLRARDEERTSRVYLSKAFLEYAVGAAAQRAGAMRDAGEAYGRALTEDMSYYMAHARLGDVAAAQSNLAEAAREYVQAVEIKPDDGVLRFRYGVILLRANRLADAEVQLREAVRLEPHWLEPYGQLAVALDRQNKTDEAVAMYRAYAVRVPLRLSSRRDQALARAAELETGS